MWTVQTNMNAYVTRIWIMVARTVLNGLMIAKAMHVAVTEFVRMASENILVHVKPIGMVNFAATKVSQNIITGHHSNLYRL